MRPSVVSLCGYVGLSVGFSLSLLWLSTHRGSPSFVPGPYTSVPELAASLIAVWLTIGAALVARVLRWADAELTPTIILSVGLTALYSGVAREHVHLGDFEDYRKAAENVAMAVPLHSGYLYPPFLAICLSWVLRVSGDGGVLVACLVANLLAVPAFFMLACEFLRRTGLSRSLSSLLLFMAMAVSTPLLRTTVYVQMNLIMLSLVLAAALSYRRFPVLSALALAFGTHLKVIPGLYVPLFLERRRWYWVVAYAAFVLTIAAATIAGHGVSYYFDFYRNLTGWHDASFRSASIQSTLLASEEILGINLPVRALSGMASLGLFAWVAYLVRVSGRNATFSSDPLISGLVPGFFLMMIMSPVVWEHHLVVLTIPAVLVGVRMQGKAQLLAFLAAYGLCFVMPTFDWYPWSSLRLVGWMGLLGLLSLVILRSGEATDETRASSVPELTRLSTAFEEFVHARATH